MGNEAIAINPLDILQDMTLLAERRVKADRCQPRRLPDGEKK